MVDYPFQHLFSGMSVCELESCAVLKLVLGEGVEKSFKDITTAFDEKYILVDRLTGKIEIK